MKYFMDEDLQVNKRDYKLVSQLVPCVGELDGSSCRTFLDHSQSFYTPLPTISSSRQLAAPSASDAALKPRPRCAHIVKGWKGSDVERRSNRLG